MRYFQAQRIETAAQLRESLADAPPGPWVVQPYLTANLCAIGGVAWQGSLVCAVHQIAHRIWPPDAGYSSYAETVPADEQLEQATQKLLEELQWSGVFQLQFMRTRSDSYFIDFNPRIYGSIALAIAAGRNLPAIWADLVLGKEPKITGYRSGVRYRVEHNDARAILRLFRQGAAGVGAKALLPRRNTVHGVVSLRDPGPLRALLAKAAMRVSSRLRRS
jgi:predicted ATP-grasp superfamily ATP-dependent carboligase